MNFKRRSIKMLWIIAGLILGLGLFIFWQNNGLTVTEIDYSSDKLPEAFEDYRVLQISDLHNKDFGKDQQKLLQLVRENEPNIIVITGDLIDRRRYDLEPALEFIRGAVSIADVYYVSGNHEAWSGEYLTIKKALQEKGVNVLDDQKISIKKGEDTIDIIGLMDPDFRSSDYIEDISLVAMENVLLDLSDEESFQILLSHRPELFEIYKNAKIDLTFSGHAHGGQFRLPLIGGIIAPGQGFFPEYTGGLHQKDESSMVVSRGLGNSIIPVRIWNRPEVVVLNLNGESP